MAYYHSSLHASNPFSSMVPTGPLRPDVCTLEVRQQPVEALVANKEKVRKPIDPPPFVQLKVSHAFDPQQQWQQNPYIFMRATLLKADRNELYDNVGEQSLLGSYVSSLHRLKDDHNQEGGFFVFGDISVKVQGIFRLRFSLHEFVPDLGEVSDLGTVTSLPFEVAQAKDFTGMKESTFLSTLFADQGVRLRLRKEARTLAGNKRGRSEHPACEAASPEVPNHMVYPNPKRVLREEDCRRDSFPESTSGAMPLYNTPYQHSNINHHHHHHHHHDNHNNDHIENNDNNDNSSMYPESPNAMYAQPQGQLPQYFVSYPTDQYYAHGLSVPPMLPMPPMPPVPPMPPMPPMP